MNKSLEREIAEMAALTSPRKPNETHSGAQPAPNQTLRASWLQLTDLLETASLETASLETASLEAASLKTASTNNRRLSEPESSGTNKALVDREKRPSFSKNGAINSADKLPAESRWAVWAVAGSLLIMFFVVGARLPAVQQNPLAPIAEFARLPNRNSTAALQTQSNTIVTSEDPALETALETTSNDDLSLAWDSGLDDAIASAEIAVWSFESNSRPAEQAFRWVDTQIQQLEQDFQDNSL